MSGDESPGLIGHWRNEWNQRTTYGRLLFPFRALSELLAITVLFVIFLPHLLPEIVSGMAHKSAEIFALIVRKWKQHTPDVYQ